MNTNTILETANHIMQKAYTNASFSDMNVILVSKEYLKALQDDLKKAMKNGWKDEDMNKVWLIKNKEEANSVNIIESVNEVDKGDCDYIVFGKSNLVILSKDYSAYLWSAFDFQV